MSMSRPLVPEDLPFRRNGHLERRSWQRAISAKALGIARRGLDPRKVLKGAWPDDERAEIILRAAQAPTSTANFPVQTLAGSFRSLMPGSAAWKLFDHPSALRLDLAGIHQIEIPNFTGLLPRPIFIGEDEPAPALQWPVGKSILGPPRKILVLSAVSGELDQSLPETAAAVIGRVLSDVTNQSVDVVAFDANAADTTRPAGLLFGVTPIAASAATDPWAAMNEDLASLCEEIGNAGVDPSEVIFVMRPREGMLLRLRAGPEFDSRVLTSLGVTSKSVVAIAPAGIASGYQGPPTIETSREALLHFEDAAPADIVDVGGTPAAPAKSAYQLDLISLRVKARAAWCAAPGAVAVVENVVW
jgi:hypothetical protein